MDIKKLKESIDKLMKKKNISTLIIILLVVTLIYIVVSYFSSVNNISNSKMTSSNINVENNLGKEDGILGSDYEEKQKAALKNILSKIEGVGDVDVMINFEGSEVKIPAIDKNSQKSVTEENDGQGGTRVNEQETGGDKVVMSNSGNGNEPLILKTEKPKIVGIVVVAEGASDKKIQYEIGRAVSSLYDIGADKVNVFSMKK